jgi:predicted secreted protein
VPSCRHECSHHFWINDSTKEDTGTVLTQLSRARADADTAVLLEAIHQAENMTSFMLQNAKTPVTPLARLADAEWRQRPNSNPIQNHGTQ